MHTYRKVTPLDLFVVNMNRNALAVLTHGSWAHCKLKLAMKSGNRKYLAYHYNKYVFVPFIEMIFFPKTHAYFHYVFTNKMS